MFRLVNHTKHFGPQLKSKISITPLSFKQNKWTLKIFKNILNKPIYCRFYTTQSLNNNSHEKQIKLNEENTSVNVEQNTQDPVEEEFDKYAFQTDLTIPFIAKITSSCILLPFIACSIGPFFLPLHVAGQCVFLQMTLGSSMLSFFGGVHWGLALANYKRNDFIIIEDDVEKRIEQTPKASTLEQYIRIAGSVLVPCASWMLMSLPPVQGMVGLMICYTAFQVIEMGLHSSRLLPSWFMRLKSYLTFGIVLSFGINLIHML